MALHDTLVEIGSLDGASGDDKFAKAFVVQSWNFSVQNDSVQGTHGKANFSDLSLTLAPSKGNASLAEACANHAPQATVKLHCRAGSTDPKEMTTLNLKNGQVTHYTDGGSGGHSSASVSIHFTEIEYKTGSVDAQGNITQGNEFKFDVAKNKKI